MEQYKNFRSTWENKSVELNFKRLDIALMGNCISESNDKVLSLTSYAYTSLNFLVPAPKPIKPHLYTVIIFNIQTWVVFTTCILLIALTIHMLSNKQIR